MSILYFPDRWSPALVLVWINTWGCTPFLDVGPAMASPFVTFLENYHWKGYTVDTVANNSNTMMCLHRGNFPMHRYWKNTEIGCVPFNLLEAWVWVHMEKWNILWADDETWLPQDVNVRTRDRLPHGFHKVLIDETDEDCLQVWVEVAGRGFYPFAGKSPLRLRMLGKFMPIRFVARSAQQCAIIAEVMHAYNLLGNRIEVYAPQAEGIALTDHARINSAMHEDDRSCFDFRASQVYRDAIAGRFPNNSSEADRIFHLSEGIHLLQKQHNDLVHEANQAIYRVQQSWHMLSEAYAALVNG